MPHNDNHYSPQQVANTLKISKPTLFRHEKEGKIPKFRRYQEGPKKGWRYATENDVAKLKVIFKKYK